MIGRTRSWLQSSRPTTPAEVCKKRQQPLPKLLEFAKAKGFEAETLNALQQQIRRAKEKRQPAFKQTPFCCAGTAGAVGRGDFLSGNPFFLRGGAWQVKDVRKHIGRKDGAAVRVIAQAVVYFSLMCFLAEQGVDLSQEQYDKWLQNTKELILLLDKANTREVALRNAASIRKRRQEFMWLKLRPSTSPDELRVSSGSATYPLRLIRGIPPVAGHCSDRAEHIQVYTCLNEIVRPANVQSSSDFRSGYAAHTAIRQMFRSSV